MASATSNNNKGASINDVRSKGEGRLAQMRPSGGRVGLTSATLLVTYRAAVLQQCTAVLITPPVSGCAKHLQRLRVNLCKVPLQHFCVKRQSL